MFERTYSISAADALLVSRMMNAIPLEASAFAA
jgi:hypothetical protein